MAQLTGIAAINTYLQIGNGQSPETFTTIANVSSISGVKIETKVVDTTSHSTANPWMTQIPTLIQNKGLTFKIFWVMTEPTHDSSARGLRGLLENRTLADWQVIYPDGNTSTDAFLAYVTQFDSEEPVDGVITASITLSATGKPSLV